MFVAHLSVGWICDAIFEGADRSQKIEVLTVTVNFRVNCFLNCDS